MAKLSLLDAFGLSASGSLLPGARLAQILPQFLNLKHLPLDQVQFADGQANFTFREPLSVAVPGVSVSVGGGAGGHMRLHKPAEHVVDVNDPFASINIGPDEIYIELALELSTAGGVKFGDAPFAFGLSDEHAFTVTVYRRFSRSPEGSFPLFAEALGLTFQSFVVPQTRADLDGLDINTVVVTGGTGKLKLSSSFGISMPVHQLAATSPMAGNILEVNASASFTAELSVTLAGAFQSRIRKLGRQTVELGIYRSQSRTLAVQVSAQAGLAAKAGGFDLAEKFIGALSLQPVVDLKDFQQALPGEDPVARDLQIQDFQTSLEAAICTTFQGSLTAGLSIQSSNAATLTYQLDLNLANSEAAVSPALHGDFLSDVPGIKQTSNVFTQKELAQQKISLNLLGILNFVSVGKLARISTIQRNASGDITLVNDAADANHLQALLLNAAGNAKRLRSMLSEDFLLQASFKAIDLQVLPPEFCAKHTFLEVNEKTGSSQMKHLLDVCRSLGLLTGDEEAERLKRSNDFGRTTFWLQTTHSAASLERTFFKEDGSIRTQEEYETFGRRALAELLTGEDGQEFRKLIADPGANGTSIWQGMKQTQNIAQFNQLFGLPLDVLDPRVRAAAADFICITSWASAMKLLGDAILDIRALIKGAVQVNDDRLTEGRERLKTCMAAVVKHSGDEFGEPLGLVMVYFASQRSAGAKVIATGPSIAPLTQSKP